MARWFVAGGGGEKVFCLPNLVSSSAVCEGLDDSYVENLSDRVSDLRQLYPSYWW
jgi:hypothetical protein